MFGKITISKDEKDKDDKAQQKATKTIEDFGSGVVTVRVLDNRIKALKQTHWGTVDEKGQPAGAISWLSDVMEVILGLGRLGAVPEDQLRAAAWWVSQCQRGLDKSTRYTEDQNRYSARVWLAYSRECEDTLRYYFAKWSLVSVRPEDVAGPLAILAVNKPPGYDREPQKLVDSG